MDVSTGNSSEPVRRNLHVLSAADVESYTGHTPIELFGSRRAAYAAAAGTQPWMFSRESVRDRIHPSHHAAFEELVGLAARPAPIADAARAVAVEVPTAVAAQAVREVVTGAAMTTAHRRSIQGGALLLAGGSLLWLGSKVLGSDDTKSASKPKPDAAPPARDTHEVAPGARRLHATMQRTSEQFNDSPITDYVLWDLDGAGTLARSKDAGQAHVPASVTKVLTALAVLDEYGADHRFTTDVLQSGDDLVIRGGGDPELTAEALDQLAKDVRDAGITHVDGDLLIDDSAFDRQWYVASHPESFRHGAEVEPIGALTVQHSVAPDPGLATGAALRRALKRAGVTVEGAIKRGEATSDAEPLAKHRSRTLAEIVKYMNTVSDNTYAETLIQHVGRSDGAGAASTKKGVAATRERLQQLGVAFGRSKQVDGSGLANPVSGVPGLATDKLELDTVADVLQAAWNHPDPKVRDAFRDSLAVAGQPGSLEGRLEDLDPTRDARVVAKTGGLTGAATRAGYIVDADGAATGYVMFANGNVTDARDLFDAYTRDVVRQR